MQLISRVKKSRQKKIVPRRIFTRMVKSEFGTHIKCLGADEAELVSILIDIVASGKSSLDENRTHIKCLGNIYSIH
jgi:hypothetical protein